MEKLKTYLKNNGISHDAFGKEVGATQATITRYVRGDRFPAPEMIVKIAVATNGTISASDWYSSLTPVGFDAVICGDGSSVE